MEDEDKGTDLIANQSHPDELIKLEAAFNRVKQITKDLSDINDGQLKEINRQSLIIA